MKPALVTSCTFPRVIGAALWRARQRMRKGWAAVSHPNRKRKRNTDVVEAEVQGQEVIRIVRRIDVVLVVAAVVDRRLILDHHTVEARGSPGLRVVQPERGRAMSPGSLTRQLSSIPESRTEGDGDDTEKTTKDSVEKKPSSSGKVGNFQGHVATMVMQGGRDENQNKTSWKSVLQTNLNERIDNVGTKEAGSGAAKRLSENGI